MAYDAYQGSQIPVGSRALGILRVVPSDQDQKDVLQQLYVCAIGTLRIRDINGVQTDIPIPGPMMLPGPIAAVMVAGTALAAVSGFAEPIIIGYK